MIDIDYIMELFDWSNSEEEWKKGLELAKDVRCVSAFIQPGYPYGKRVWDKCAEVFCEKTDDEIEPYLLDLFEWLEDYNWPGALKIRDRLISFSGERLKSPFCIFLNEIKQLSDGDKKRNWCFNLSGLLENEDLKNSLEKEYVDFLQREKNLYENGQKR